MSYVTDQILQVIRSNKHTRVGRQFHGEAINCDSWRLQPGNLQLSLRSTQRNALEAFVIVFVFRLFKLHGKRSRFQRAKNCSTGLTGANQFRTRDRNGSVDWHLSVALQQIFWHRQTMDTSLEIRWLVIVSCWGWEGWHHFPTAKTFYFSLYNNYCYVVRLTCLLGRCSGLQIVEELRYKQSLWNKQSLISLP